MTRARIEEGTSFRTLARAVPDAVLLLDADGVVIYANPVAERLFGGAPDSLSGRPSAALLAEDARAAHARALGRTARAAAPTDPPERLDVRGMAADGTTVPLEAGYAAYEAADGGRFVTLVLHDVSVEREHEARLRFQARLLDAVGEAVIATDPRGRVVYWNAAAEALYGWSADEAMGRPIQEVTPAEGWRARTGEIMARMREGETWTGEFIVRHRDGHTLAVLLTDSPVMDESGKLLGIIGASKEISHLKRSEDAQRFLAEAGRVLASSLDRETTLGRVSRLAVPLLGEWCMVHMLEGGSPKPVAHCAPKGREADVPVLEEVLTGPEGVLAEKLPTTLPVPVTASEAATGEGGPAKLARLGIGSLLVVPLELRGEPDGVLTFARPVGARGYDRHDLWLAGELALRASSALENTRLYREAEESDRAKTDFLAVVSHELRTPLNAIMGYAELLTGGVSGELNDRQRNQVERMRVSAGHLAQIIDEILAFARMERGNDSLVPERVDAGEIVRDAIMMLQAAARAKRIPVRIDAPARLPEISTDPGKLRQVLVNLLGNAIKYTDRGQIAVRVREMGNGLEIAIQDTGIGIPPDQQERIFEPFRQVQSPNTRTVGGTGLGLSVTRRLVELMGGTIGVESSPGAGSTFTVRIPLDAPERHGRPR